MRGRQRQFCPYQLFDLSPLISLFRQSTYCIHSPWHVSSQVPAVLSRRLQFSVTTEIKLIYWKWSNYKKGSSLRLALSKEQQE